MQFIRIVVLCFIQFLLVFPAFASDKAIGIVALETDFGLEDSAVSEMKGVIYVVDKSLVISDVTHEIPPFNIWEAAYRLYQVSPYWPKGTVFVIVVDPGVGTKRKSIVALSNDGNYYVAPDNGILTLIADSVGITEVREIDENTNRLAGSNNSHTFYGRDVFGYTAAKLASGKISYEKVGPRLLTPLVKISYLQPTIMNKVLQGMVVTLDKKYGNVWTNIDSTFVKKFNMKIGKKYHVHILYHNKKRFNAILPFCNTFGDVARGASMLYMNSLLNLSIGTNQGDFAKANHLGSGEGWRLEIE